MWAGDLATVLRRVVPDKPRAPSLGGSAASLEGLGWTPFGVDIHKYPLVDRQSLGYAPTWALSLGWEQQNLNQQFRISQVRGSCLRCFCHSFGTWAGAASQPGRSAPGHALRPEPPRCVHGGTYSLLGGRTLFLCQQIGRLNTRTKTMKK